MEFGTFHNEPILKRIPEQRNLSDNITEYGADNLYPQRIREVLLLSPIAKSAVSLIANFIRGDGFTDGDEVTNRAGETANDLLRLISDDYSLYNGFALFINGSGIGNIEEVQHIPFEFVRLGLARQDGLIRDCKISNNWESSNADKLPEDLTNEKTYKLYKAENLAGEALKNRGMVYYYTPKKNSYPLASIDAIIETCQSDNELQLFELGNLVNGFLSASIFKYPSGGDTENEEEDLRKKLSQLQGSRNANSVLVASIDEDWEGAGSLIEQIPANNNDSLFINTTLNVKNRILQNFALPAGLMGMLPDGAVFTATQLADEYVYMNLRTKDMRNLITRELKKLGLDVGEIMPNQFEAAQMKESTNASITG